MRQNVQCFAGVSMQVKDTSGLKTVAINGFLYFYYIKTFMFESFLEFTE